MADQDRVRRLGIERAVGFLGDLDAREHRPAIEHQRPGQRHMGVDTETMLPRPRAWKPGVALSTREARGYPPQPRTHPHPHPASRASRPHFSTPRPPPPPASLTTPPPTT